MDAKELNALIREEVDGMGAEVDMWDLTDRVIKKISKADVPSVMRLTLQQWVVATTGLQRRHTLAVLAPDPAPLHSVPPARPGPSRMEVAHAAWKSKLEVLVSVEGSGVKKRLGACTAADIETVRNAYLNRSRAMSEQAEWFDRIAKAMRATKVGHVADLPETTLRPLLEKVAA